MDNDMPLHDAVQNGKVDIVRLLVSQGASLTARNMHGYTPVQLALTDVMKEALSVPADPSKLDTSQTEESILQTDRVAILCSKLSREQKIKLDKVVHTLHGKVLSEFTNEVTHVVTDVSAQGTCARTLKYMEAVLRGLWVLTFTWVETCEEYGQWVSEEPFEIPGTSLCPTSYAPCRARRNQQQQMPGLFDGCSFAFVGNYEYPSPSKEELVRLVKIGGATVLTREPREETVNQSELVVPYHTEKGSHLENCGYFVVHDNKSSRSLGLVGSRLCHVNVAWLLDCITNYKLQDPAQC